MCSSAKHWTNNTVAQSMKNNIQLKSCRTQCFASAWVGLCVFYSIWIKLWTFVKNISDSFVSFYCPLLILEVSYACTRFLKRSHIVLFNVYCQQNTWKVFGKVLDTLKTFFKVAILFYRHFKAYEGYSSLYRLWKLLKTS